MTSQGYTYAEVIQMELECDWLGPMSILQEFFSTPDRLETAEEMASFFNHIGFPRSREWEDFARRLNDNRVGEAEKEARLRQYRAHHGDTR